jgi:hypothetical protein
VVLQEHHQKAESNEDHHMHILPEWVLIMHVILDACLVSWVLLWVSSVSVLSEETVEKNSDSLTNEENYLSSSNVPMSH